MCDALKNNIYIKYLSFYKCELPNNASNILLNLLNNNIIIEKIEFEYNYNDISEEDSNKINQKLFYNVSY